MGIKERMIKLSYWNYDKEVFEKHRLQLNKSNVQILSEISRLTFVISLILAPYFYYLNMYFDCYINVGLLVITSIIRIITKKMIRGDIRVCSKIVNGIIDFGACYLYIACIISNTFLSTDNLAVTAIWMFLIIPLLYDRLPKQEAIVIVFGVVFIICSVSSKDFNLAIADTIHCVIVMFIGIYMSWNKSKGKMDYIIAQSELEEKNNELYYLSTTDELTKLYNRKKIFEEYHKVKEQCGRDNTKMYCIVMDVDNFKAYNDTYGHPKGDELLKKITQAMKIYCDKNNISLGRIGGEEFLAVWKENKKDPKLIAENIRLSVCNLKILHENSDASDIVTISQGLFMNYSGDIRELHPYLCADKALYRAKSEGKNRCCIA